MIKNWLESLHKGTHRKITEFYEKEMKQFSLAFLSLLPETPTKSSAKPLLLQMTGSVSLGLLKASCLIQERPWYGQSALYISYLKVNPAGRILTKSLTTQKLFMPSSSLGLHLATGDYSDINHSLFSHGGKADIPPIHRTPSLSHQFCKVSKNLSLPEPAYIWVKFQTVIFLNLNKTGLST